MLKGEWLTLVTMMVLFFANFTQGAITGIVPDLVRSAVFLFPTTALTAFCSGVFLGRSLFMISFSKLPA